MKASTLLACAIIAFAVLVPYASSVHVEGDTVFEHKREPIVLIPGFASSRLMAWKQKLCGSGFNINIGDRVWIDAAQVLYDSLREGCWSDCMALRAENQTDPEDCKLRPVSSIEAISELDPGSVTGPLSSIFRNIIDLLSGDYNYDTTNLAAAPYDWRLPPNVLEERDRYFSQLKATIEELVEFNQKPAIIIAHSMGNNIFLYFTEWIKLEYPTYWEKWFQSHISSFFAVGAPLLGSPQSIRVAISGDTFGLPLSEAAVRRFMTTYGSGPWMFPLSDPGVNGTRGEGGWPHHPVTVDYNDIMETRNYTVESVLNATVFQDGSKYDKAIADLVGILDKFYYQQKINPLASPPQRPPVENVYCVYGINVKTEIGYQYRIVDEAFRIKKMIWEDNGGEVYSTTALLGRKESLKPSSWGKSGDGTVSYNSLNWCQAWHMSDVELKEVPTEVDNSSRLQGLQHMLGIEKLIYGKYRYDSTAEVDGRTYKTSVIELEHQNHRDIIRAPSLIELLKEELDPRTNVQYVPFKSDTQDAVDMTDLETKSTRELEDLIRTLQKEVENRARAPSPTPMAADTSKLEEKKEGRVFHHDNTTGRRITPDDEKQIHRKHESAEGDRDDLTAAETPDGDGYAVLDTLVGRNKEGNVEEVEDIRDDDTGHEFSGPLHHARMG